MTYFSFFQFCFFFFFFFFVLASRFHEKYIFQPSRWEYSFEASFLAFSCFSFLFFFFIFIFLFVFENVFLLFSSFFLNFRRFEHL